mmetsp:Transcript_20719/g.39356  ORF Transcript_20719/g.39356 Transcript_20719/m.39356 type:complete len:104 (+) Transcript_20719:1540-1851(+)
MVDDWSWQRTKSMKWAILTNNDTHGEPRFCSIRRQEAVHPINQPRIRPNPLLGSLVKKRKKTRKNETKSIPGERVRVRITDCDDQTTQSVDPSHPSTLSYLHE